MLRALLPALAVLALAAAPAYAQDVTFKKSGIKAGDARTEKGDNNANIDINISNNGQQVQSMNQKTEEKLEKTVEILAATDGKPTKFKVSYKTLKRVQETQMTGRQEQADPLEGKSFILEKSGDAVTVTDDQGGKVDDLTADSVKNRESALFKNEPSKFAKILPDRAIKVGETINVDKEKASAVLNDDDDGLQVESMTLTLKETKTIDGAEVAVFETAVKGIVQPQGPNGPTIKMDLTGKILIGVDTTWPYKIELSGPMSLEQNQGPMSISAKGKTTVTQEFKYTRKSGEATKGF